MARIAGVDLPRNKKVYIALRYLYGVGPTGAAKICEKLSIADHKRVQDLTEDEVNRIREEIDKNHWRTRGAAIWRLSQERVRGSSARGESPSGRFRSFHRELDATVERPGRTAPADLLRAAPGKQPPAFLISLRSTE